MSLKPNDRELIGSHPPGRMGAIRASRAKPEGLHRSRMNERAAAHATGPAARILGDTAVPLWGLMPVERWRRWCARAGIADCGPVDVGVPEMGTVILLRADAILDESLARPLRDMCPVLLMVDHPDPSHSGEGLAVAAHISADRLREVEILLRAPGALFAESIPGELRMLTPAELGSGYSKALRKRAAPYAFRIGVHPTDEIERRMFHGAYKGVTDLVTKWIWPVPALWVTRWVAARGISANMVTTLSLVLVVAAMWLFAAGQFFPGLAAAWAMAFLDTVDGKLARVTLTSTRLGEAYDHGIDLIHPPFWYATWWYGLQPAPVELAGLLDLSLWAIVLGYLVGRLMEGFFLWRFKFEIHAWRRIDSNFRLISARRNPNVLILSVGTLLGRPDLAFAAVAAWTAISLAFHGVRILQALQWRRRGRSPTSWLSEAAPSG